MSLPTTLPDEDAGSSGMDRSGRGWQPIVSVIIPTCRRASMLPRAIDSALRQTCTDLEVIVVDDNGAGSPERLQTEQIMSAYAADRRVVYLRHEANSNAAAARNTGIRHSRAEFIAFLDDDDEFLPRKIELQLARLQVLDRSWGAVYCGYCKVQGGRIVFRTDSSQHGEGKLLEELLLLRNKFCAGSTLLIRRDVLVELGGFDPSYTRHQDWELLVRFFRRYRIACVPELLARIHLDVGTNRPNVDAFIATKEKFLNDFAADIATCPPVVRNAVLKTHMLAIATRCFRSGRLRLGLRYARSAGSFSSLEPSELIQLAISACKGAAR